MGVKLFTTVTFHDTTDGVPVVGTVDGFERDEVANCTVVHVVIPHHTDRSER